MSASSPDYSNYFWQGEKVRLRPWRLDDAELRFLTSLDSPSVALHQDGIELPTSIEFWQKWLEKVVSGKDDSMIRFAMETSGWMRLLAGLRCTAVTKRTGHSGLGLQFIVTIAEMAMLLMRRG